MRKRVLLTGASGFVGSHMLRHLLTHTEWEFICPVTFRHRGNQDRVASALVEPKWHVGGHVPGMKAWAERVHVIHWDLTAPPARTIMSRVGNIDYVLNVASESHVDRSIVEPAPFVRNNVDIMLNVMELCRELRPELVMQMSTDEVYGPAPAGVAYREWDTARPSNPYSASKVCQESIGFSYWRSYDVPLVITNTMNIIGEMQDPEKFLPKTLRALTRGEPVEVHVGADDVSGSRFYLHARNLADAWLFLVWHHTSVSGPLPRFAAGAIEPARYHVVGEREVLNSDLVKMVARAAGITDYRVELIDYHSSRPGHDLRYALDGSRIADLGWRAPVPLDSAVKKTVTWTLEHQEWL